MNIFKTIFELDPDPINSGDPDPDPIDSGELDPDQDLRKSVSGSKQFR